MELNFKEAFTFMFKDEKFWQKYLSGTLFMIFTALPIYSGFAFLSSQNFVKGLFCFYGMLFLSIIPAIVNLGYASTYAQSKISTTSNIMPEWTGNLGKITLNGLKFYVGYFLFSQLFAIIASFIIVPVILIFLCIIAFSGISPSNPEFFNTIIIMGIIGLIIFIPILITSGMLLNVGITAFLPDLKIFSFFNFRRIRNLAKNNLLNLFILTLFFLLISVVKLILWILLKDFYFLLLGFFGFYLLLVGYNLYAQYAQIGMKKHVERMEAIKQAEAQS